MASRWQIQLSGMVVSRRNRRASAIFTVNVQVSVTIDIKSALLYFMQQVGNVGPTAHVQSLRYPF